MQGLEPESSNEEEECSEEENAKIDSQKASEQPSRSWMACAKQKPASAGRWQVRRAAKKAAKIDRRNAEKEEMRIIESYTCITPGSALMRNPTMP